MFILFSLACTAPDRAPSAASADTAPDTASAVPRGALRFSYPLEEREPFSVVMGMDHDPEVHEGAEQLLCSNYDGEPWPSCYDEHRGSDFLLDGTWDAMEAGSVWILVAADGVVVETHDGEYDHCHGDLATLDVSCDGYPVVPNKVVIEHDGGYRTSYLHMMTGSVAVADGDAVRCGDRLGKVGSSGYSSQPHLHFELKDPQGASIDPYAGAYSQPETWWEGQWTDDGLPADACP